MKVGVMLLPRGFDETRDVAVAAERLGFSWLSVADSPSVYQESYLHQMEVARVTEHVRISAMVSHLVVRHPVIVGNLLATLDEYAGGRVVGTLATGNSAARGLGLAPSTVAELGEGVEAIRGLWRGEGGPFGASEIPATGIRREGCPLFVAGDGPKAVALAGAVGDGLLYGGTMAPAVAARRLAAGRTRPGQEAWIAPTVSLGETHAEVRADLGAMVVAMANRAMRGDLEERGVPAAVQADVLEMRRAYDYGFHADSSRPHNDGVITDRLASHLVDGLCLWGDAARWAERLDALEAQGWDGVMLILGQAEQGPAVRAVGERLRALGRLTPGAA